MVTGTLADEMSRFRGQSERFRRGGPETDLHRPSGIAQAQEQVDGVLETISTRDGLAQAILAAEILGKPRALRPYKTRT